MFDTEIADPFDQDKNDSNETAIQGLSLVNTNNDDLKSKVNTNNDDSKAKPKGKSKNKSKIDKPVIDKSVDSMHLLLCYSDKYEGTFQVLDGNELIDAAVITIKDQNNQLVKAKVLNPTFDLGDDEK